MNSRTISVCFVSAMLKNFATRERMELLHQTGLPTDILEQSKARISPAQFSQLSRLAMKTSDDESCGHLPQRIKLGTYRVMAQYAAEASDLRNAFERSIRFWRLFEIGCDVQLDISAKFTRYQMIPNPESQQSPWVFEQHLMLAHRYMSWLVGTPIPLTSVNCHYAAPPHKDEYHYLFFSPTRFDQTITELVFETRVLDLPVVRSPEELDALIRRLPYNLLFMPTHQKGYTEQIRRYIRKSLPNAPSYEQIATSLGLTAQTLRRRLREEGCDYRQIRNELLRDTAIELLQQTDKSIQEISYELGFSEPSAFIRSFRNWTGLPPNHYRLQHAPAED